MANNEKQSTEKFVSISDIRDNAVILKDSSLRAVVEVSAINFELRSEDEQMAILQNFQKFLNSVDFPLQIAIKSRRINIDEYLKVVSDTVGSSNNELVKIQGTEYMKFIKELAELANIMQKKFYVVIPFYITEAPTPTGLFESVKDLIKSSKERVVKIDEDKLETAKNQLLQRVGLIYDGLIGLGVKAQLLDKNELLTLFYGLYNHDNKTVFKKETETM